MESAELTDKQRAEATRRHEARKRSLVDKVGDKAYLESLEVVQDLLDDAYDRMKSLELKDDLQLKVLLASVEVSMVHGALESLNDERIAGKGVKG